MREEGYEMDDKIAQLILDELFSSLENLETQTAAVLQFLREKGGASEEQLAPYLEQAGRASSIKRRAARVRIDYLLSGITNPPKKTVERDGAKGEKKSAEPEEKPQGKTQEQPQERDGKEQSANQKGETKAEGKTEVKIGKTAGKTEERPQNEQHRGVAKALVEQDEKEKRSTDRGKEKEGKNKPAEREGRDHKTGQKGKDEKRKDEKESGQEPRAAKSSTGK
jgi:hypothetical protein